MASWFTLTTLPRLLRGMCPASLLLFLLLLLLLPLLLLLLLLLHLLSPSPRNDESAVIE